MKKYLHILSALACAALMTACGDSKEEPDKPATQDSITITDEAGQLVTTLNATAANAPIILKVSTNFDWQASSAKDWAHLTPESGKAGDTRLTLTMDANTGTYPRSTTLSFKKNGLLKANISLIQEGGGSVVPTYRSLKLRQSNINQMTFTESGSIPSLPREPIRTFLPSSSTLSWLPTWPSWPSNTPPPRTSTICSCSSARR